GWRGVRPRRPRHQRLHGEGPRYDRAQRRRPPPRGPRTEGRHAAGGAPLAVSVASLSFAAFVVAVLVVYHVLPHRFRVSWLLASSSAFYAAVGGRFALRPPLLTLLNLGLLRAVSAAPARRDVFWLAVAANLLALGLLRRGTLAGAGVVVGLSFYTLQAISCLADQRSGTLRTRPGGLGYALYLAYFPRLLAGPIERARRFPPQLERPGVVDDEAASLAVALVALGVVRKVVIADPLRATIPAAAFTDPARVPPAGLIVSLVAFAFVVYNDFAGYTGIVRGVSRLFGIELSPNFRQ